MPKVYSNQSNFGTQEEILLLYEAGCVCVQDIFLNEKENEGERERDRKREKTQSVLEPDL